MKLFEKLRKEPSKTSRSQNINLPNALKLDKYQLSKVIGGAELIDDGGVNTGVHKRPGVL